MRRLQIPYGVPQQLCGIFEVAKSHIAMMAQKTSYGIGRMIVVHANFGIYERHSTNRALKALRTKKRLKIFNFHAVLIIQPSSLPSFG
jgi:hypothetical protein